MNCERCGAPLHPASGYCGTGLCQRCATGGVDRPEVCSNEEIEDDSSYDSWWEEDFEEFDDF